MTRRRLKFSFTPDMATQPVVYNLGHDFGIVTNICRADIAGERGWVVLELEGSDDALEQGLAWVTAKGVNVEPAEPDVF